MTYKFMAMQNHRHQSKMQIKQNRAPKTLFNLDYRSPTLLLHQDLNIQVQ